MEDCESFFNFFNPPQVPEEDEDIDEDKVWYLSSEKDCYLLVNAFINSASRSLMQAEELQNLMEQDYDIGCVLFWKYLFCLGYGFAFEWWIYFMSC